MIDQALLTRVKSLSPSERLELIGVVWESLDVSDVPISEAERAILDSRIEDEANNPADVSPWPEAEARLRQRLR